MMFRGTSDLQRAFPPRCDPVGTEFPFYFPTLSGNFQLALAGLSDHPGTLKFFRLPKYSIPNTAGHDKSRN